MNDPLRCNTSLDPMDLIEKREQDNLYTWENATLPSAEVKFLHLDYNTAIIESRRILVGNGLQTKVLC